MGILNPPPNDELIALCASKGYPTEYNEGLIKVLQVDLGSTTENLNELLKEYYDTFKSSSYFGTTFYAVDENENFAIDENGNYAIWRA